MNVFKKHTFSIGSFLAGGIVAVVVVLGCKSRLELGSGAALADSSTGSQPYSCFVNATKPPYSLSLEGAVALCGGTSNASLTLGCFQVALNTLSLNMNGALSLCSANFNVYNKLGFRD